MNSSRYLFARFGLAFGLHRKNKRLSEAAEEMHLLRMAEEIMGEDVWKQCEDIEDISVEYWTMRKLAIKKQDLEDRVREAGNVLDDSHEERNALLGESNQACLKLEKKRDELVQKSEVLVAERDHVVSLARQLRRKFDASRTKIQVLSAEAGSADIISDEKKKMEGYRVEFEKLKKSRDEVGRSIARLDEEITTIESKIAEDRQRLRQEASEAYQSIGKANRDVSQLTAEIGLIELDMQEQFVEIGRYVSTHAATNDVCRGICKNHENLVAQMHSLRSSIALNHKLAALAGN